MIKKLDRNYMGSAPTVDDAVAQIEFAAGVLDAIREGCTEEIQVEAARVFDRKGSLYLADLSPVVAPSPFRRSDDDVMVRISVLVPQYLLDDSSLGAAVKAQEERSVRASEAAKAALLQELEEKKKRLATQAAALEAEIAALRS